jgi:transposase
LAVRTKHLLTSQSTTLKDSLSEMVKTSELSLAARNHIVGMFRANVKKSTIAKEMGLGISTIHYVISKWLKCGNVNSTPRSGRPPKLGERDARRLVQTIKKNRTATLENIHEKLGIDVSKRTIQRKLLVLGIQSRSAIRKPFISKVNAMKRLTWCRSHRSWSLKDWKRVIWSDECMIELWQGSRDKRIRRTSLERFNHDCIAPTIKHGGGRLMVWACFRWEKLGPIIVIDRSMDSQKYIETLESHLYPFWKKSKRRIPSLWFQHDGAPCHRAGSVKNWLMGRRIRSLAWPAQSPDLNAIEHVWNILKNKIQGRRPLPQNLEQLKDAIYEEWSSIDPLILRKLVSSMSSRIRSVICCKGYQTKY